MFTHTPSKIICSLCMLRRIFPACSIPKCSHQWICQQVSFRILPVIMLVQRPKRGTSPLRMFSSTVSAMSSAL